MLKKIVLDLETHPAFVPQSGITADLYQINYFNSAEVLDA